jgi:ABC-type dipeptide/oligopeptide/nickel transport system ATPase component
LADVLVEVEDLRVAFPRPAGEVLHAVAGISFRIETGQVFGLVGESGSGKSVSALALLRLVPAPGRITGGRIMLAGRDILKLPEREVRAIRGRHIAMIFQNAQMSLNPVFSIGSQLSAVLRLHRGFDRKSARREATALLDRVRIPDAERRQHDFPHELSGGLCQRVMIAMALACRPRLLVADEPTSSLDVTVQAQILDLLMELRSELDMAILLISHNLSVVAQVCNCVGVMQNGRIVEAGDADEVLSRPTHPYTKLLLDSVPRTLERRRHSPTVETGRIDPGSNLA